MRVADLLPAGLGFVSDTPSQGTYDSGGGLWTVGTVTAIPETLQILATVLGPAAQTNTASINHSDQFDPVTANNSASATETPQQADLALTKTVSNAKPNVGDTITFTITLTDKGPSTATNVQVTDLLPAGLTFVSAAPSEGTYVPGTGIWTVGTVTTMAPQTLQIQASVTSPAAQTNTATISHADQFDPVTSNNSASVTETPQRSDLALSKTVTSATPNVGDIITFEVLLGNLGPDPATDVQVTDLLPTGLIFVSATPSQGTYVADTGLWTVGTVATGTPKSLQIRAKVVSADPETNTAAISNSDQFDPNTGNNSASATETPQQADLALSKTVSNPTPNVGDTITFTVTLTNNGAQHGHQREGDRYLADGYDLRVGYAEPGNVCRRHRNLERRHSHHRHAADLADSSQGGQPGRADEYGEYQPQRSVRSQHRQRQRQRHRNASASRPRPDQDGQQCHAQCRRHDHVHRDRDQPRHRHCDQRDGERSFARRPHLRLGHPERKLQQHARRVDRRHRHDAGAADLADSGHGCQSQRADEHGDHQPQRPVRPRHGQQQRRCQRDAAAGRSWGDQVRQRPNAQCRRHDHLHHHRH